jgi:hypothetical protein
VSLRCLQCFLTFRVNLLLESLVTYLDLLCFHLLLLGERLLENAILVVGANLSSSTIVES